jgi:membrane-associated phospholipid phosphatase
LRLSNAIRATAWTVVVAGAAAPMLRRRAPLHPGVVLSAAAAAPVALCVVIPRTRTRDVVVCALQMWAYVAAYKMPHDDPDAAERRVHVHYPIAVDRALGLGRLPSVRLQQALSRKGEFRRYEKLLVWVHWVWFFVPHAAMAYVLVRRRDRFGRAAVLTYAVFDVGAAVYWLVPTAPPWYAAASGNVEDPAAIPPSGRAVGVEPAVRRMMVEYGEVFWKDGWGPLYSVLGGNPLAAMPSLHFATSVMAATILAEVGPVSGALGWGYALTLGFALVYLGEHYVVDLVAGAALTGAVHALARPLAPALEGLAGAVGRLEGLARG